MTTTRNAFEAAPEALTFLCEQCSKDEQGSKSHVSQYGGEVVYEVPCRETGLSEWWTQEVGR